MSLFNPTLQHIIFYIGLLLLFLLPFQMRCICKYAQIKTGTYEKRAPEYALVNEEMCRKKYLKKKCTKIHINFHIGQNGRLAVWHKGWMKREHRWNSEQCNGNESDIFFSSLAWKCCVLKSFSQGNSTFVALDYLMHVVNC